MTVNLMTNQSGIRSVQNK